MHDIVRTIRKITASRFGAFTTLGVVFITLALSLAIASCEEAAPAPDITPPSLITLSAVPGNVPNSIEVTWTDPVDADFSHILLYWTPTGSNVEQPLKVEKGIESATITELSSDFYTFTAVTVDTSNNVSATSERIGASTDVVSPSAITLTATAAPNGDVEITWNDPLTSNVSHILISWEPVEDHIEQPLRVASGVETAAISGLTEAEDYVFTAVAVDDSGNESDASAPSASVTVDGTGPSAVDSPTATPGDSSSIALAWTDPTDSDLSHILVSWDPPGDGILPDGTIPEQPVRFASGTEAATIMHLAPGAYEFSVQFVDTTGNTTSTSVTGTATPDIIAPAGVTLGGDANRSCKRPCGSYLD